MAEQRYFIPISRRQLELSLMLKPDNLGDIYLHLLVEGVHIDDLKAVYENATANGAQIAVESRAHTLLTGRLINLEDILCWAIKHGYLDDPERFKYEDYLRYG
jgi:hypothetical protein